MSRTAAIVVLGHRSHAALEAGTIDAIRRAARRVAGVAPVVYLDNYSRDGSLQWLAEHAPDVDVLLAPENLGYCRGVNALLQYAARRFDPRYYVLVDADNPAEPDCYRNLIAFLDAHPGHGMAQPLVHNATQPDRLYSCGHRFTADHWCMPMAQLPDDDRALWALDSCSISSTAVRASMLRACGLLDPVFEMYYESADLSLRARAHGFGLACVAAAVAYNDGTDAEGVDCMHQRYYFNRNRLLFWRMHDEAIFAAVAREARATLADLTAELVATEFGLDAVKESVRRGLAAGLELSTSIDFMPRPRVALDGYDRTTAVVVQRGA